MRDQSDEAEIFEQRERVAALKRKTADSIIARSAKLLLALADTLVKKSVWIVGGDGWAMTSVTADSITCSPAVAT